MRAIRSQLRRRKLRVAVYIKHELPRMVVFDAVFSFLVPQFFFPVRVVSFDPCKICFQFGVHHIITVILVLVLVVLVVLVLVLIVIVLVLVLVVIDHDLLFFPFLIVVVEVALSRPVPGKFRLVVPVRGQAVIFR